jgi:hypothetical protein
VVVPIRELDRAAAGALAFAQSIGAALTVLQFGRDAAEERRRLRRLGLAGHADFIQLGEHVDPVDQIIEALDDIRRDDPRRTIAVVLGEVVPRWPWLRLLHDPLPRRLKSRLLRRPGTVVIEVPYRLDS